MPLDGDFQPSMLFLEMDPREQERLRAWFEPRLPGARFLARPSVLLKAGVPVAYDLVLITDEVLQLEDMEREFIRLAGRSPATRWIFAGAGGRAARWARTPAFNIYDAVQRPYDEDILHHVVMHALEACRRERRLAAATERIQRNRRDRRQAATSRETLQGRLSESEGAIKVLEQNTALEHRHAQRQLDLTVESRFRPLIEALHRTEGLGHCALELDALLTRLIPESEPKDPLFSRLAEQLTVTELRVAILICCGLNSSEIARQLRITPNTLNTHRKNIRKKLNINSPHHSLNNFLLARTGKPNAPVAAWAPSEPK